MKFSWLPLPFFQAGCIAPTIAISFQELLPRFRKSRLLNDRRLRQQPFGTPAADCRRDPSQHARNRASALVAPRRRPSRLRTVEGPPGARARSRCCVRAALARTPGPGGHQLVPAQPGGLCVRLVSGNGRSLGSWSCPEIYGRSRIASMSGSRVGMGVSDNPTQDALDGAIWRGGKNLLAVALPGHGAGGRTQLEWRSPWRAPPVPRLFLQQQGLRR
jgi:hypothetical protein